MWCVLHTPQPVYAFLYEFHPLSSCSLTLGLHFNVSPVAGTVIYEPPLLPPTLHLVGVSSSSSLQVCFWSLSSIHMYTSLYCFQDFVFFSSHHLYYYWPFLTILTFPYDMVCVILGPKIHLDPSLRTDAAPIFGRGVSSASRGTVLFIRTFYSFLPTHFWIFDICTWPGTPQQS